MTTEIKQTEFELPQTIEDAIAIRQNLAKQIAEEQEANDMENINCIQNDIQKTIYAYLHSNTTNTNTPILSLTWTFGVANRLYTRIIKPFKSLPYIKSIVVVPVDQRVVPCNFVKFKIEFVDEVYEGFSSK